MIGVGQLVLHLVDVAGFSVKLGEFFQNLHFLGSVVEITVAASELVQGVVGVERFQFLALFVVGDGVLEFALHEVAVTEAGERVSTVFVLLDVGGEVLLESLLCLFVRLGFHSGVTV